MRPIGYEGHYLAEDCVGGCPLPILMSFTVGKLPPLMKTSLGDCEMGLMMIYLKYTPNPLPLRTN